MFTVIAGTNRPLSNTLKVSRLVEESLLENWGGPAPGELLSIDWDCFASVLMDEGGIAGRVDDFLRRLGDEVPSESYVVYSPEYSHPSLDRFRGLLEELQRRFDQPLEWLSPDLEAGRTNPADVETGLPERGLPRLILRLRRMGIY